MDLVLRLIDQKTIRILEALAKKRGEAMYLREISRLSGINPASTFRILKKLVKTAVIAEVKISKFTFYRLDDKKLAGMLK